MRLAPYVVASLAVASPAWAQSTSWHVTAAGDVAVTDNVYAAPSGSEARGGDLFFQLRPGALYTINSPRMVHELGADAELVHYAFNSRVPSVSGRVGWRALFLPGPRSELSTSIAGSTGILTSLQSRLTADETMINVAPASQVTFRQADASQSFAYVATRELRLQQQLFARVNDSDDNADELPVPEGGMPLEATRTKTAEAGFGLGLSRVFKNDSLAIDVGGSVQRFERIGPSMPSNPQQASRLDRNLTPRARAVWTTDINRRVSFALDGGLVLVYPFGEDPYNPGEVRESGVYPVAGGQLSVNDLWGRGTMTLRREVSPNQFLAQNTVNTSAAIAAAVPLPWLDDSRRRSPKLAALGSVTIQRTQLIDPATGGPGQFQSSIGAARLDIAVIYTPRPGVTYGARYELTYQTGDDRALVPIQGFYRNTLFFTFSVRYPDRVAGVVPKKKPGGARGDRRDDAIGSEPVVPELIEEGDGESDER